MKTTTELLRLSHHILPDAEGYYCCSERKFRKVRALNYRGNSGFIQCEICGRYYFAPDYISQEDKEREAYEARIAHLEAKIARLETQKTEYQPPHQAQPIRQKPKPQYNEEGIILPNLLTV